MYDRDWYREERRKRRYPNTQNVQPQTNHHVSGPPEFISSRSVVLILALMAAVAAYLGFA